MRVDALEPEERKIFQKMIYDLKMAGVTQITLTTNIKSLLGIKNRYNLIFHELSEADVRDVKYNIVTDQELSEATKSYYVRKLKKIYNYDWLHYTPNITKTRFPSMLEPDEVVEIIDTLSDPRDKAIVAVNYDLGCRPNEVLKLNIEDVIFDNLGVKYNLFGKTGPRMVRGIFSIPYIKLWMQIHPYKDKPDAPLWVKARGMRGLYNNERLEYNGYVMKLRRAIGRTTIKKKVTPYLFRHTRITENAGFLTEAQLCAHHGWVQGSNMSRIYVHMNAKDVDSAILTHHGLVVPEDMKPKPTVVSCPRCDEMNNVQTLYCWKCGMPLKRETLQAQQDEIDQVNEILADFMKDPEFVEMVKRKAAARNILKETFEKPYMK